MTLMGKILTVLILVMSICFMMIAVTLLATHSNWHESAMANKTKIEELQQINVRLREEQTRVDDRLAVEQASRRFALAALQTRLEQIITQLRTREAEYSRLLANEGVRTETLSQNTANLEKLIGEVAALRNEIRTTQQDRDKWFDNAVVLTDTISGLQGNVATLQERELQLRDDISAKKLVMDAFELDENTPVVDIPPRVDGIVTQVGETKLVEISLGADDGLRVGHTLEVSRANSYLGRIKVKSLEPDRAVCEILPEYRKGIIKRGDRVATKLS